MTREDLISEILQDIYSKTATHTYPSWNTDYWKGYCKACEYAFGYSDLYKSISEKVELLFNNIRAQKEYPFRGVIA